MTPSEGRGQEDSNEVGNWGRWGSEDESGALNLVDTGVVTAALAQARTGEVISLAQPFGPAAMTSPHRRRAARFMDRDAGDYAAGARSPDGFKFAEDTVQMPTHSATHLDALGHTWTGDTLYNGHPSNSIRSTTGAGRCGAEKLTPVVTRGVLLDMAREAPLEPGAPITAQSLMDEADSCGLELRRGDAVLIRTGWWERGLPADEYHVDEPGITLEAAQWLTSHDVCVIGADNYAVEQQPSPRGSTFPVHLWCLHRHGLPLLENLDLGALAATRRSQFMFVMAPLPLIGSTAGPVNPLAVL